MNRREIFVESDTDNDNCLSLNEVVAAFQKLQSKITSYPAVRPNFSLLPSLSFSLSPVARAPLAATPPPADIQLPSVDDADDIDRPGSSTTRKIPR